MESVTRIRIIKQQKWILLVFKINHKAILQHKAFAFIILAYKAKHEYLYSS